MRCVVIMWTLVSLLSGSQTEQLIQEGDNLVTAKKYESARKVYVKALEGKLHPLKRYRTLIKLADIEMEYLNLNEEALFHLLKAKTLFSEDAYFQDEVFYRLGIVYEKLGDYIKASDAYQKVIVKFRKSEFLNDAEKAIERTFKKNIKENVAVVEGEPITKMEFEEYIEKLPPFMKPKDEESRRKALERLIQEKLLLLAAEKRKLYLNADFREKLMDARKRLLLQTLYEKLTEDIKVSEAEKRAFYDEKRDERYKVQEKYDFQRIEVKEQNQAEQVLRLLKRGVPFDSMAKQYSIAPDAKRGGMVNNFTERSHPQEYWKLLRGMREGDIRGPLFMKTNEVYAVIKLLKKYPAGYRPYEEVSSMIENELRNQKLREFRDEYLNNLMKQADIKILIGKQKDEKSKKTPGGR